MADTNKPQTSSMTPEKDATTAPPTPAGGGTGMVRPTGGQEKKATTTPTGGNAGVRGAMHPASEKDFSRNPRAGENKGDELDTDAFADDPARVVAKANFSLAEFQEIYAAIRDGDYWTAFRRCLSFLNGVVNAPAGNRGLRPVARGAVAPGEQITVAQMKEIDRSISLMEQQLNSARGISGEVEDTEVTVSGPRGSKSAPLAGAGLDIMSVLALAQLVLEFVKKWRENRQG